MRRAFSLLECLTVISLSMILLTLCLPSLNAVRRNAVMAGFADQLTGYFVLAQQRARQTGRPTWLDFQDQAPFLMTCYSESAAGEIIVLAKLRAPHASLLHIDRQLPQMELPHPTRSRILTKTLTSSHKGRYIFTMRGSSSGTLVFSDGQERAVCVVLSGMSGRFQVFLWQDQQKKWSRHY